MSRRLGAARRGQAMVEFALHAALLMLLTMGLVDFGLAIWQYNTVSYLAREGARYGIIPSRTCADIRNYTVARGVGLPGLTTANVTSPTTAASRGIPGDVNQPVVVTVTYTYVPASPMLAALVGSTINLQASASMYVEQGATVGACP